MEWKIFVWIGNGMKKIASMKYGKIVFCSILFHPLIAKVSFLTRVSKRKKAVNCKYRGIIR